MDKRNKLLQLAHKRQQNCYESYKNLADFYDGYYEVDYVSPYSTTAHNVNADVMLIIQDWSSTDAMEQEGKCPKRKELGYTKGRKSNVNLFHLLQTHLGVSFEDTYATNLFPFIKQGNISAKIPQKDLRRAARDYTLPMIQIIQPKIAICFGIDTFNAVRKECGHNNVKNMDDAVKSSFNFEQTKIVCQSHPGQLGKNNRNKGGVDRVTSDWQKMAKHMKET